MHADGNMHTQGYLAVQLHTCGQMLSVCTLLSIFLITEIGPGFCLKENCGKGGGAAELCVVSTSHPEEHRYSCRKEHALSLKGGLKAHSDLLLIGPLISLKSNCPLTWCQDTHLHAHTHTHTHYGLLLLSPLFPLSLLMVSHLESCLPLGWCHSSKAQG